MVYLTEDELILILLQALVKARKMKSKMGYDKPKIHVAIQGVKRTKEPVIVHSDEDASEKLKRLSQTKASLALSKSNDNQAMTSYSVAHLTDKKEALSLAGGVPLYKQGELVGSVAISGDAPEVDEAIAHAAAERFEPHQSIRSDVLHNIPYKSNTSLESPKKRIASPVLSSGTISTLPTLPKLNAPSAMLPPLTRSDSLSKLPALPLSPKASSLPLSPKASSLPLSPKASSLPPLSPKASSLPPLSPKASSLPPLSPKSKRASLPKLKSSLTVSGLSADSSLPSVPSPKSVKFTELPPISKLSPVKK